MANKKLTTNYSKVKSAGKISTMRVLRGTCELAEKAGGDPFPLYSGEIITIAANVEVWARGTGLLCIFESEPQ